MTEVIKRNGARVYTYNRVAAISPSHIMKSARVHVRAGESLIIKEEEGEEDLPISDAEISLVYAYIIIYVCMCARAPAYIYSFSFPVCVGARTLRIYCCKYNYMYSLMPRRRYIVPCGGGLAIRD